MQMHVQVRPALTALIGTSRTASLYAVLQNKHTYRHTVSNTLKRPYEPDKAWDQKFGKAQRSTGKLQSSWGMSFPRRKKTSRAGLHTEIEGQPVLSAHGAPPEKCYESQQLGFTTWSDAHSGIASGKQGEKKRIGWPAGLSRL